MKMIAAIAAAVLVTGSPAHACSISPSPKIKIEQIKARTDLRKVRGVLRVEGNALQPTHYGAAGPIFGRLETRRGKVWEVFTQYDQLLIDCAYFFAPTHDAEGTFWIERRKTDGRYRILLWEGAYLRDRDSVPDEGIE